MRRKIIKNFTLVASITLVVYAVFTFSVSYFLNPDRLAKVVDQSTAESPDGKWILKSKVIDPNPLDAFYVSVILEHKENRKLKKEIFSAYRSRNVSATWNNDSEITIRTQGENIFWIRKTNGIDIHYLNTDPTITSLK